MTNQRILSSNNNSFNSITSVKGDKQMPRLEMGLRFHLKKISKNINKLNRRLRIILILSQLHANFNKDIHIQEMVTNKNQTPQILISISSKRIIQNTQISKRKKPKSLRSLKNLRKSNVQKKNLRCKGRQIQI